MRDGPAAGRPQSRVELLARTSCGLNARHPRHVVVVVVVVVVVTVVVVIVVVVDVVVVVLTLTYRKAVRGHRTGSNNSGLEKYLKENNNAKPFCPSNRFGLPYFYGVAVVLIFCLFVIFLRLKHAAQCRRANKHNSTNNTHDVTVK